MLITLKCWKKSSFKNVKLRRRSVQGLMILLLKMCLVFGQQKVIVIDPGHGGTDSGAIGINDILEKDVVLNVAKEIIGLNKTLFDERFAIYPTRYTDTLISLKDRSRLAKALKADVFVSLHCNWILRFVLCHPFRSYSARHFGLICATSGVRPDSFRFVLCQ